jgi:polysaccharide export outer membrane protein
MVWAFMASFKWGDLVKSFDRNRVKRTLWPAFQGGSLYRKALALGWMTIALSGCAIMTDGPDHAYTRQVQQPQTLPSAVLSRHEDHLSHATMERLLHQSITYHLGAGDVVSVSVYLHPDLSIPSLRATSAGLAGAIVTNDGNIQLPLLGVVHVAGMTTTQLQTHLTHLYAQYVIDPKINVQLQVAHSIRYYLLGEFIKPGLVYSDRPLNVLEAMALGGSVNLADADLRGAYVVQDGRKLPVNFHKLILAGDLQQNIPLKTGDTVLIPSVTTMRAYVFGAVTKAGSVPFVNGRLSLLQALSDVGMNTTNLTTARLSDIRIIRSEGATGTFYVVNARRILEGKAAPFFLKSGDIVFVPQTTVSSWNQAIQLLLPSLQAISQLLNPFVSIKFLSQ